MLKHRVRCAVQSVIRRARSHPVCCAAAAAVIVSGPAIAAPNVALDDPVYDQLDQRELGGELPLFRGGLVPLSESRVRELVPDAPALAGGWWLRPIARAALRVVASHDDARAYSTAARPRDLAGMLALSCEGQEGRPCGTGLGVATELDSAAGYGAWIAGAIRLRGQTGSDRYASALELDRAYVQAELGPIAAELGRDVIVLGPAAPTVAGWSTNAPPLDHLRLSGSRPLALSPRLRGNVVYVLGRLAAPQTYPGDLVSIARAQLDIADRVEVGAMQLLQLGGDGAPGFGLWDFVLEHVHRRDLSASASDSSNRRLGLDVAVRTDWLGGTRITYQLVFEDLRREIGSAVRHDADHVVDVATRWLTIELQNTGERSYEHVPRTTGFTSGGRIVGDPIGPAALAMLVAGRISMAQMVVAPWAQVARLGSDTYAFGDGPVARTSSGETELRFRIGARARVPLGQGLELAPEVALEEVVRAAFVSGARRTNTVLRAVLVWRPGPGGGPSRSR